jgi:hypothetical protein
MVAGEKRMRVRRRARELVYVASALWLAGCFGMAAAQEGNQYRGTEEQRMACTPDVFRLCWGDIPNVDRIVACLKRERPRLSAGCRAVFEMETASARTAARAHRRHHYTLEARAARRQRSRD